MVFYFNLNMLKHPQNNFDLLQSKFQQSALSIDTNKKYWGIRVSYPSPIGISVLFGFCGVFSCCFVCLVVCFGFCLVLFVFKISWQAHHELSCQRSVFLGLFKMMSLNLIHRQSKPLKTLYFDRAFFKFGFPHQDLRHRQHISSVATHTYFT